MKFFPSVSVLFAMVSFGVAGCGSTIAPECAGTTDCAQTAPQTEVATQLDPATELDPIDEEDPVDEPPEFIGEWTGIEVVKSFNGNVFFDFPAVDDELTLTMVIADDLSVDYFQDIPSSETTMTGTVTMDAASALLTLDLAGEVVYTSGNTSDTLGDFTCTVDVDTMTCAGANDEEGDILEADIVFERM